MSEMQFEDDHNDYRRRSNYSQNTSSKGMVKWLVEKGIAPTERVAEIILIVATVLFFATSIYLFRRNTAPSQEPTVDQELFFEDFY